MRHTKKVEVVLAELVCSACKKSVVRSKRKVTFKRLTSLRESCLFPHQCPSCNKDIELPWLFPYLIYTDNEGQEHRFINECYVFDIIGDLRGCSHNE